MSPPVTAAGRDGGGEAAGREQGCGRSSGGDGEEVQAGEGEVQRGAGGGGEEAGGSTQTVHLADQEEAVGEFLRVHSIGFSLPGLPSMRCCVSPPFL